MTPIRVVLADDHVLVRAGIRALLEKMDGIAVVGEASDGHEALELLASTPADVILLDITMPRMNGLVAAARIASDFPSVGVLMLSVHGDEEFAEEALRLGASGYLRKDASHEEFHAAVRTVVAGGRSFGDLSASAAVGGGDEGSELTPRQAEVLQLMAEGRTTKEIARILQVSPKTVETHRAEIRKRLDAGSLAEVVRHAVRMGLVG